MEKQESEESEEFVGRSRVGFSAAVEDAVRRAEEERRLEPPATLVVTRMEVDVEGPIGEFRVALGPGG